MKSKDAAKLLNCTHTTLHNYVKNGKIAARKLDNGYWEYDDDSVCKMIGEFRQMPEGHVVIRTGRTIKEFDVSSASAQNIIRYCETV